MSDFATAAATVLPQVRPEELRVTRIRALRGPNFWRLAPVIACDVHLGSLEELRSTDLPGFTDRLLAALPTLHEHPCSRGAEGGFVERLREGTHLPHILEHVALELQTLAGSDASFGRVVESGDPGVWWVIVAYDEEEVGLECMRQAVRLVQACLVGPEWGQGGARAGPGPDQDGDRSGSDQGQNRVGIDADPDSDPTVIRFPVACAPIDVPALVHELQLLYEESRLGPSTAAVVEEARRRGIPVRRLNSRSLVQLGLGKNARRIQATLTDNASAIAVEIAQDKDDTKRLLENVGLPVPRGDVARSVDDALAIAKEIGFPVILKPLDASQGRGISPRLDDAASICTAWPETAAHSRRVVVEQFAEGRDHRVLVVNGKVVACAERLPAHVVGDGVRSIRALVDEANRDPRRGVGHAKILTRIPLDAHTTELLARSHRTPDDVPAAGECVVLRATANLSTGGTSVDRTDEMHPDNVTACEHAAAAVGLDVAGIDVMTPDISVPFRENRAVILEVNAAPGIRMHTHPTEGVPRNVAAPVIDMLYPPGTEATIPIVAVTGTNGKTTTTRLVAHLFRNTGKRVGFTTTDGVYIQNRLVMEGDMTGPFAANIILSNPSVEVAVLETARGGILRAGLGFEECDVGVVMNVSADHLGLRGIHTLEQLAEVKAVIPATVKREGHAVLNADDPLVYAMRERTGADVVLLSAREEGENALVEEHVARGGIAVSVQAGTFVIRRGRLRIPVAAERDVPLMLGGAARFQRGNVLAAIAAAYVRGMRYDDIRAGLLSFFPSPSLTPGRLNLLHLRGGGRVLVDYAHNAAALDGLLDLVTRLPATRRIGVLAVPGDRRDDDVRAVGILGARLDAAIVKEDDDLRGRRPGETAALVVEGLRAGGMAEESITVIADEHEAVATGLRGVAEDDLLVVLADKVGRVLQQVRAHAEAP